MVVGHDYLLQVACSQDGGGGGGCYVVVLLRH